MDEEIEKYRSRCEQLKSETSIKLFDNALTEIERLQQQINLDKEIIRQKELVNNELIVAFGSAKKDKESIKEHYVKLEKRYAQLQEEMALNKKTIDLINDHILELQFENNILHQKLKN
jgi:putative cell wall-binding protein